MEEDKQHYQYGHYTTGRKQDYGHHELSEENGWVCYDWDRNDYTETMWMKKPLPGKGWKPFRVFTYAGIFEDFVKLEDAQRYFDEKKGNPSVHVTLVEVDVVTGNDIRTVAKYPEPKPEEKTQKPKKYVLKTHFNMVGSDTTSEPLENFTDEDFGKYNGDGLSEGHRQQLEQMAIDQSGFEWWIEEQDPDDE